MSKFLRLMLKLYEKCDLIRVHCLRNVMNGQIHRNYFTYENQISGKLRTVQRDVIAVKMENTFKQSLDVFFCPSDTAAPLSVSLW